MPRPPIERSVGGMPRVTLFKPAGVPARELEQLPLAIDELEAIRLVDLEGLSHEQAASVMGVSRQTVGRVLERGRAKVTEALVTGKAILIGGGQYRVEPHPMYCFSCETVWQPEGGSRPSRCVRRARRVTWVSAGTKLAVAADSAVFAVAAPVTVEMVGALAAAPAASAPTTTLDDESSDGGPPSRRVAVPLTSRS